MTQSRLAYRFMRASPDFRAKMIVYGNNVGIADVSIPEYPL